MLSDSAIGVATGSCYDKISVSLIGQALVTISHGSSFVVALLG